MRQRRLALPGGPAIQIEGEFRQAAAEHFIEPRHAGGKCAMVALRLLMGRPPLRYSLPAARGPIAQPLGKQDADQVCQQSQKAVRQRTIGRRDCSADCCASAARNAAKSRVAAGPSRITVRLGRRGASSARARGRARRPPPGPMTGDNTSLISRQVEAATAAMRSASVVTAARSAIVA